MSTIQKLSALEILDSRGRPTVQATCVLASGAVATVSVPSGPLLGRRRRWNCVTVTLSDIAGWAVVKR